MLLYLCLLIVSAALPKNMGLARILVEAARVLVGTDRILVEVVRPTDRIPVMSPPLRAASMATTGKVGSM